MESRMPHAPIFVCRVILFIKNLQSRSMGKQYDKKITWTVKKFSSLPSDTIYSDTFVVGGCKWNLRAYPKGNNNATHLSLYLGVVDHTSLPSGWRRYTKYRLIVVNQFFDKLSHSKIEEIDAWFDEKSANWGISSMCPLNEIYAKDSGFLLNDEVKIVVELDVLEVIGKLDVTEETSTTSETMDVNGFLLLPSQAKYASRMFERHSEIASNFRPKNQNLRTGYMSLLLSLIETISQSPKEMSKDDLFDAYTVLGVMRDAGFKLDWLERKLDEVTEKKKNEEASETRIQEMEEELKDFKQKCSNIEALLEKEKAKVSAPKAPIPFDDIVS